MDNNETVAQVEKTKKKKKKLWIILAVVAVLIIAVIGSSGSSEPTVDTPDGQNTSSHSDSSKSTGDETQDATKQIKVGSSVTDDELKITFTESDANFTDYSKYASVTKGCKVIRVAFTFENISSTDEFLNGFECYADGEKCENFYSVDDYSSPTLESVSPGRKFSAVVYYEVPKDAKEIELEYESDSWSSEKYIFIVE